VATTEERLGALESAVNSLQADILKAATNVAVSTIEAGRDLWEGIVAADIVTLKNDSQRLKAQLSLLAQKMGTGFSRDDVTISDGAITLPTDYFLVTILDVATENLASTDNLDTINGGQEGNLLILLANDSSNTVVAKHGTGNLYLDGQADFSLTHVRDTLVLAKVGSEWFQLSSSNNDT